jgi:hypothetical protein
MNLSELADISKAAGSLLPSLFAAWRGQPQEDPIQKEIYDLTSTNYNKFRYAINNDNMRVILHLETCTNCNARNLFQEVHRDNLELPSFGSREREFVIKEFTWRLEYLSTIGMINQVTGGEYAISHLGKNFARRARDTRDYIELMRR